MPSSSSRREIYTIIAIGSLGFLGGIRRLAINRDGRPDDPTPIPDTPLTNNQILANDSSLPEHCTATLRLRDCIMSTQSGDTTALSLYRQQITSERNIQTPAELSAQCETQYRYLQSLSGSYPTSCR